MFLKLSITSFIIVLLGLRVTDARISSLGTTFCPERCVCRKADLSTGDGKGDSLVTL